MSKVLGKTALGDARGIVVSAPSSGSGKTIVTLGLLRALADSGRAVVSAKVGPDYIDPRFHEASSGRVCFNLDGWAMRPGLMRALVETATDGAQLAVVEGVMGLFDGSESGHGSTADVAAALGLPVIFVLDVRTQGQSAAAVIKGFATFREDCRIGGVILNRIGSPRHADMIRHVVEDMGVPVVGAVPNMPSLDVPSRHLGLVQAAEHPDLEAFLRQAAKLVEQSVDLGRLGEIAAPFAIADAPAEAIPPLGQRIAVGLDRAFGFAYPHLLEAWRRAGSEIMPFSPLADEAPDDTADAVFLPGGYPELHAGLLSGNHAFKDGTRAAAERGALVYGECGGFMVLGEALIDADGERHDMTGLLPLGTSFATRKLHLGYRYLRHDGALPLPQGLRGHEFHYSTVEWQGDGDTLFTASDSAGRDMGASGLRRGNVMGSYAHIIDIEAGP